MFFDLKQKCSSVVLVQSKEELERELVERTLCIFDDQLINAMNKDYTYISTFFLEKSHHLKLTTFFMLQVFFPRNGGNIWIANASHFVFFKSINNSNIVRFFRNFGADADFLYQAYKLAVEGKPYAHFFVSFHQKINDFLRYRSSMIPSTGVQFFVNTPRE